MNCIPNPFSLDGKTILVTGASSGIGKAIAIECSKMGARLIITGRNKQRLDDTFMQLPGKEHIAIVADITQENKIKELIDSLCKIDGIVLAAGIVEMLPTLFANQDKFKEIYQTNLFAPIELLRLIVKKKKSSSTFSAVAISSVAGNEDISVANGIYGSGKAAFSSFLKYFALENAKRGIRVNTISPGMILTPMHTKGVVDEKDLECAIQQVPLKRWGRPEEIAYAAIYLLSDASSYITGADIKIDGGITI